MSGPTLEIYLPEAFGLGEIDRVDAWLQTIALRAITDVWDRHDLYVSRAIAEPIDDPDDDSAGYPVGVYLGLEPGEPDLLPEVTDTEWVNALGWIPADSLAVVSYIGSIIGAHRAIARMAQQLASEYSGVIDLDRMYKPVLVNGSYRWEYWESAEDRYKFLSQFPGHYWEVRFPLGRPRDPRLGPDLPSVVVDVEFLGAWLQHPGFYLLR